MNTRKRQRSDRDDDHDHTDDIQYADSPNQRAKKIKYRAGIGETIYNTASTLVNTAAEAVVLVTILGMAAYSLWKGQEQEQTTQRTQSKEDTSQNHIDALQTARRPELPPPYEAVYYQSSYKTNDGLSSRRSPNTPKRVHAARSARRRVALPVSRPSAITSSTDSSPYSTTLPPVAQEEDSAENDNLFNNMSSRLQSLIQQGTEALASPSSSNLFSETSLPKLSSDRPQQLEPAKDMRKSLPATLIPSPSLARHCPRLSKS